ncbi:MAG: prepilin-type N-terminal cleavage/methylation domain-containing protein [Gammaproteobacteria bacterium]|nr:MAG: prepilin-type N-terminal cleavage/methylation domain-containing protein [Gammaproteobacteria bacterium]
MAKQRGFTLVELLVTVSIAAILLATGLPAMQDFIKDSRITTAANALVTATQLARTAAVQYAANATLCISSNHRTCSGTRWTEGWMVWVDKNRNGALDRGEALQYFDAPGGTLGITATTSRIRYDYRGFVTRGVGTFVLCDDRTGETGRRIHVRATGRTEIERNYTCS